MLQGHGPADPHDTAERAPLQPRATSTTAEDVDRGRRRRCPALVERLRAVTAGAASRGRDPQPAAQGRNARRRRHVGRRRLVGRRGAAGRGRPRRRRPLDAALRSAAARGRLRASARAARSTISHDARRVAAALGIPHYIINFERQFHAHVVRTSSHEYAQGRTPIPCTHCNSDLKFSTLLERATAPRGRGARDRPLRAGRLRRAAAALPCCAGRRRADGPVVLPLRAHPGPARAGAASPSATSTRPTCATTRAARGLPVADKPDSHEICFVPDGDYAGFVERRARRARGRRRVSSTWRARRSAATTASTASRSASARGSACRRRRRSTWWRSTPTASA